MAHILAAYYTSVTDLAGCKFVLSKFSEVQHIRKFSLGNLSLSLEDLDISMCNMRGNIPDEIGNLTSLTFLNFGTQSIAGINSNYNGKTGESPRFVLK